MPFVEVATVGPLPQPQKREMARLLTEVFAALTIPPEWVTMVFRQIDPGDYAVGGRFVCLDDEGGGQAPGPVMLNITIGALEEAEKRRIVSGISDALTAVGFPESHIKIYFRHVTGRDIAEGGGVFTFRPPGSTW